MAIAKGRKVLNFHLSLYLAIEDVFIGCLLVDFSNCEPTGEWAEQNGSVGRKPILMLSRGFTV